METNLSRVDHSLEGEYRTIRDSAGKVGLAAGFLKLKGPESLEFLNRLSTNDLRGLREHEIRPTILTTEKGRMIDVVLVVNQLPDLLLIVSEQNSQNVKSWLDKFIIMENIIVEDVTHDFQRTSIIGPLAPSLIGQICAIPGEPACVPLGSGLFLYRDPLWTLPLYHLAGPPALVESLWSAWRSVHPEIAQIPAIGGEAVEILRIERGIPAHGKELTDEVNPLEAGLSNLVSFTKGCYIGQEVIARVDTYGKLRRKLCGFVFPDLSPNRSTGRLLSSGLEVGWTTSHTYSYQLGKDVALGYLKGITEMEAVEFRRSESEPLVPLKVVELPFQVEDTHTNILY